MVELALGTVSDVVGNEEFWLEGDERGLWIKDKCLNNFHTSSVLASNTPPHSPLTTSVADGGGDDAEGTSDGVEDAIGDVERGDVVGGEKGGGGDRDKGCGVGSLCAVTTDDEYESVCWEGAEGEDEVSRVARGV